MNWQELLQTAYWHPALKCGSGALLVFLLVWWRDRRAAAWPVAATGAVWMACHLVVSLFSYLIPPKQAVDWLMAGSAELTLTALLASWKRWPGPVVMIFSGVTMLAAGWLALRQLPFLLVR